MVEIKGDTQRKGQTLVVTDGNRAHHLSIGLSSAISAGGGLVFKVEEGNIFVLPLAILT